MSAARALLAVELYKLAKRQLPWVLLAILLGFVAISSFSFLLLGSVPTYSEGIGRVTAIIRQFHAPQNNIYLALGAVNVVGALLATILGAASVGSELQWGTIRMTLVRAPSRSAYLGAVSAVVALALLVALLLAILLGLLLSLVLSPLSGTPVDWPALRTALLNPFYVRTVAISYLALLLYAACGMALTVAARSLASGLSLSLAYYLFDGVIATNTLTTQGHLLRQLPGIGRVVELAGDFLLGYNLIALHATAADQFQLTGDAAGMFTPSGIFPLASLGVVLVYLAIFVAAPYLALARQDLGVQN